MAKQQFKHPIQYIALLIGPCLLPFAVYALITLFSPSATTTFTYDDARLPILPPQSRIKYDGNKNNLVYFSYAPATEENLAYINQLLKVNKLTNVKVLGFDSPEKAEHYINVKNIANHAKKQFENRGFYEEIFCDDLKDYRNIPENITVECNFDVSLGYQDGLKQQYSLQDEDFNDINQQTYMSDILFHINFFKSTQIFVNSGIPRNITYEIVYNTSILDRTIAQYPDILSQTFGNNLDNPYWTGYGFTIQTQLDQITLDKFTNISLNYKWKRLPELIPNIEISVGIFFEIVVTLSWCMTLILASYFASIQTTSSYKILIKLGVRQIEYWLLQCVFVFVPTFVSCQIQGYIFHYFGILPLSYITIEFCAIQMTFLSLILTSTAVLLAVLFGQSSSKVVSISCIVGVCFLLLPAVLHMVVFQQKTFFDPSVVPQWVTYTAMSLVPAFTGMGIMDAMTSLAVKLPRYHQPISQYNWKPISLELQIQHNYLFEDLNNYSTIVRHCLYYEKKHENKSSTFCYYKQPLYGYINLLAGIESVAFYPVLIIYFTYVISQHGFRGLPFNFLFKKKFWQKIIIPDQFAIQMQNINIIFKKLDKRKQQCCQKQFNHVFKSSSFSASTNEIHAILGESGCGKSTILNYLTGELDHISEKGILTKRKYKSIRENFQVTNQESFCKVGPFDLINPIDAYNLKPHIGYCPQDYSNIWLNMSAYDNVKYSIKFRAEYTRKKYTRQQLKDEIIYLLNSVDLGDKYVIRRKASHLSGGMLRRLALCNAMGANPKILLLDEISAGVDPLLKYQVKDMLMLSQSKSHSLIIVTSHDTHEIQKLVTHISILSENSMKIQHKLLFDFVNDIGGVYMKMYSQNNLLCLDFEAQIGNILLELGIPFNKQKYLSVARHEFSVWLNIPNQQINQVAQQLQIIRHKFGCTDIILQKPPLSVGYLNTVTIVDETSKEMIKTEIRQFKKLPLFLKSLIIDWKTRFSSQFSFILTCFILLSLLAASTSILNLVMTLVLDFQVEKLRQNVYAPQCFSQFSSGLGSFYSIQKSLQECLLNHNSSVKCQNLFNIRNSQNNNNNLCAYYNSFLGLDVPEPHIIAIGDNRYSDIYNYNYHFSFVDHPQATQQGSKNSFQYVSRDQYYYINTSIIDYDNLYSKSYSQNEFNPSNVKLNNTDTIGILPYLKHRIIPLNRQGEKLISNGCYDLNKCNDQCRWRKNAEEQCNEPIDITVCQDECKQKNACVDNYSDQSVLMLKTHNVFANYKQFMDHYKLSLNNPTIQSLEDSDYLVGKILGAQELGQYQSVMNFEFQKYDLFVDDSNILCGDIVVSITSAFPNRGTTDSSYRQNYGTTLVPQSLSYKCNNQFSPSGNNANKYYLPSQTKSIQQNHSWDKTQLNDGRSNSMTQQASPGREHAVLFDVVNEPITQVTSALLRKQIFQLENNSNLSAWNFSYSLVSRAMPLLQEPKTIATADVITSLLQILELSITGITPINYISQRFGDEYTHKIPFLLSYHSIGQNIWALVSMLYFLCIILVLFTSNLIFVAIFTPEILFKTWMRNYNICYYFLEGIFTIPTTIFFILLTKSQKMAPVIGIFGIFITTIFQLINFQSNSFTTFFSLILPSYSMIYQLQRSRQNIPIHWFTFWLGMIIAAFQFIGIFLLLNQNYLISSLKSLIRSMKRKRKYGADIKNEDTIMMMNDTVDDNNVGKSDFFLDVKNVDFSYNSTSHALCGVSIQIEKNKVYGLLGSNGSGKSTLIHCIVGMYRPNKGQAILHLEEQEIDLLTVPNPSHYFSVVPQLDIYWDQLTLKEHMRLFATVHNKYDESVIENILSILNLNNFQDMKLVTFSGGMKRRASIAFALAGSPDILALDEPSCGLGILTKQQVQEAIKYSMGSDATIVITSHDMDEITQLVDRCCIMYGGKVVIQDEIQNIRQHYFIGLVLQIRCTIDQNELIASSELVSISQYIEFSNIYEYIFNKGVETEVIVGFLDINGMIDLPWNIQGIEMEDVFMKTINEFRQKPLDVMV